MRALAMLASLCLLGSVAGCGDDEVSTGSAAKTVDPKDSSKVQGVEIVDGRFVPPLAGITPGDTVIFTNTDDASHTLEKVSGPGRDFTVGPIAPDRTARLTPVGRPGFKLRAGTIVYRSRASNATGRVRVSGRLLRRPKPAPAPAVNRPADPDRAARSRARDLAAIVSQCRPFSDCTTAREITRELVAVSPVPGTAGEAIRTSPNAPAIWLGPGPDRATVAVPDGRFVVTSRSRDGLVVRVSGRARDPETWRTSESRR